GVALDRLDQVADQVVPPLELDVYLAPGLLDEVAQLDQPVVDADRPQDDQHEHHGDDDPDPHVQTPCLVRQLVPRRTPTRAAARTASRAASRRAARSCAAA